MPIESFPSNRPGERPSASGLNRLQRVAQGLSDATAQTGLVQSEDGLAILPPDPTHFNAKITAATLVDCNWAYTWIEQIEVGDGSWADKPGGLSGGPDYLPLYERNNIGDVPGGSVVEAAQGTGLFFVFSAPIEGPQTAGSCTTTTTTSTTTTPNPCTGSCRWTCVGGVWTLTTNSCGGTGCVCAQPQYCCGTCGTVSEQTVTSCVHGVPTSQPNCSGTTTSSTTTTSNTGTTTTSSPGCTNCYWKCRDGNWYQVSGTCIGPNCSACPSPSVLCSETCLEATTACGTPPPPPPRFCLGRCRWFWDDAPPRWILTHNNCVYNINNCTCARPSFDGTTCGDILFTPCFENVTTTTGTGTTTTIFWTTTTPIGCTGTCRWKWSVSLGAWQMLCTNCPTTCTCATFPGYAGTSDAQTAEEPCQNTTTTTTTTTTATTTTTTGTTTTSSTTTTTTTTACGNCNWTCNADGAWHLTSTTCSSTCFCDNSIPAAPCSTPGTLAVTNCGTTTTSTTTTTPPPTTTTSSTTTSTTTTTNTTCPPTSPNIGCGTCTWYRPLEEPECNAWILWANGCTAGRSCFDACTNSSDPFGCAGIGGFVTTFCTGTSCLLSCTWEVGETGDWFIYSDDCGAGDCAAQPSANPATSYGYFIGQRVEVGCV